MQLQFLISALLIAKATFGDHEFDDHFILPANDCLEYESDLYSSKICCSEGDRLEAAKGEAEYLSIFFDEPVSHIIRGPLIIRCVSGDNTGESSARGPNGIIHKDSLLLDIHCNGFPMLGSKSFMLCSKLKNGNVAPYIKSIFLHDQGGPFGLALHERFFLDDGRSRLARAWWITGQVAIEWALEKNGVIVDQGGYFEMDGKAIQKDKRGRLYSGFYMHHFMFAPAVNVPELSK